MCFNAVKVSRLRLWTWKELLTPLDRVVARGLLASDAGHEFVCWLQCFMTLTF